VSDPTRELRLEDLPRPPFFKLVDAAGADVFAATVVGGAPATVGTLFSSRELAGEFSRNAGDFDMPALVGTEPQELPDRAAVDRYAAGEADYLLVVSGRGTGLFYAEDLANHLARQEKTLPLPLYLFSDERGEAPLISVEDEGLLVAALFTSPEKARAFRERAPHLDLPDRLATIEDPDGLRRHALVARQAGAAYAVIDPESGPADAVPIEDLIGL
jgi:hypothetical protein